MEQLTIDLGKGVTLSAPLKKHMTAEEWVRMSTYLNSVINVQKVQR